MSRSESKKEKFVRLAEKRTQRAIDAIRLLGNLSNRSNYEFSDSDVKKIFGALDDELKLARDKFRQSGGRVSRGFTLR
jgi:hypothetical protein